MSDDTVISNINNGTLILPEGEISGTLVLNTGNVSFGLPKNRVKYATYDLRWVLDYDGNRILQQKWVDQLAIYSSIEGADEKYYWVNVPVVKMNDGVSHEEN